MASPATSYEPPPLSKYGQERFVVDASDVQAARDLGLLRDDVVLDSENSVAENYGLVYDRLENLAKHEFASQKSARSSFKEFAVRCGFQIFVKQTSVKPNNSGNAKYRCKKLHGAQFFDQNTPVETLECPFFVNVFGFNGKWKVTKMNLAHNHVKHVGFTQVPFVEGSVPAQKTSLHNTTQDIEQLTTLVMTEMLPMHDRTTATLTGSAIQEFLISKGHKLGKTGISRMKMDIDDRLRGDLVESYQKLESYFKKMTEKNPGSVWKIDREADNLTFRRACFVPSVGIHIANMCKRLTGYDGAHLKGEMNRRGVFLVATAKDFNNHVVPFALALVGTENYENWHWFMETVKTATGLDKITIISDRQKGLLSAVAEVYPSAGHRYCLRHIMDNINRSGAKLSIDDRRIICSMARSDCENDYKLFRSELLASKPKAVEYLDNIDQKHWVKHKFCETFGLPTFGEITSNLSEQANNWMGKEMRSSKPLDAFHMYFKRLSELTSEKRQLASKWISNSAGHRLVPLLQTELEDRAKAASMCAITPLLDGAFSVQHLGPQSKHGYIHPWRVVDLPAAECTCGNWKDEKFPCIHAIGAAVHNGSRFEELYDKIRTSIGHFQDTYTFAFKPWPTDVTLESDSSMIVPHFQSDPDRIGKRGLKLGPKPSHKRKQARNAL